MRVTVSGLLAMLKEINPALKLRALVSLNSSVHLFWREISTSVPDIENLYEDKEFEQRQLAALLISKVFYYLGNLNDSLSYALSAGPLFDLSEDSDYVHTLLAKALDEYASLKAKVAESTEDEAKVDSRLEAIVEKMLDKCISDGKYQQALIMAVKCRKLDKLEEVITLCNNVRLTLAYCIGLSHSLVNHKEYRCEVLRLLVKLNLRMPYPDFIRIYECLMFLNEPVAVASILEKLLLSGNTGAVLVAFQIALDLVETGHKAFVLSVRNHLPEPKPQTSNTEHSSDVSDQGSSSLPYYQNGNSSADRTNRLIETEDVHMVEGSHAPNGNAHNMDQTYVERLADVKEILSEERSIQSIEVGPFDYKPVGGNVDKAAGNKAAVGKMDVFLKALPGRSVFEVDAGCDGQWMQDVIQGVMGSGCRL